LAAARWFYRKDRLDPDATWQRARGHLNPAPLRDDFDTPQLSAAWTVANLNGSGRVSPPPHGEAADLLLEDGCLVLGVRHDPRFEAKSSRWVRGQAAAERYNNAYLVGLGGFLPTPGKAVWIETRMRVSPGFHGSTGVWVEGLGTFDPPSGVMVQPFRAFGFSYLGAASDAYIRGLAIETVLGLSIQEKRSLPGVDVTDWHTYGMRWRWQNETAQRVEFFIDGQPVGELPLHPLGPGEVQLWADNYQIGRGLRIGYLNVPELDQTRYDWVVARVE
jgi:hypothetical protein